MLLMITTTTTTTTMMIKIILVKPESLSFALCIELNAAEDTTLTTAEAASRSQPVSLSLHSWRLMTPMFNILKLRNYISYDVLWCLNGNVVRRRATRACSAMHLDCELLTRRSVAMANAPLASTLSIRSFAVCLLPKSVDKNAIFSKIKQFRATVSTDDI